MPNGHEYDRGRWEGRIEERVTDLEETSTKMVKSVEDLRHSLQLFNSANKEREAVSMAVADALQKLGKRRYDFLILAAAIISATAAILAALGSFH